VKQDNYTKELKNLLEKSKWILSPDYKYYKVKICEDFGWREGYLYDVIRVRDGETVTDAMVPILKKYGKCLDVDVIDGENEHKSVEFYTCDKEIVYQEGNYIISVKIDKEIPYEQAIIWFASQQI